ncbi:hypothetical protein M422DRAFT_29884 [Sphaerobolus stellatus SS14]|uniref:Uncharacterized protein n=1 Tax=Sphaerobolus stellatus (strain SS14) TaxID=990650 RepID=A0A0C9VNU6_SPHS4|nr:hypothetical protein M422DRAFT_30773 [Sphaerobolus stellatus SS14]KIJ45438.1 hypothetical protein M422DRAFT_29884 [Sphaerobolus stellatus SS14]
MASIAPNRALPSSYKDNLESLRKRLEADCIRLQELLRRREEEMRRWEEEMRHFIEEELNRQKQAREAEQWQFIFDILDSPNVPSANVNRPGTIADAWKKYESDWKEIKSKKSGITFREIPWPMLAPVTIPDSLRTHAISQFILSPEHSKVESRRRRILTALRRWHTDHFDAKVMRKVVEKDRAAVKDGVGRVVRCLNDMLAAEGYSPARTAFTV